METTLGGRPGKPEASTAPERGTSDWRKVTVTPLCFLNLKPCQRTSLAVQRLRPHTSTAGGMGLIPGQGTKIPHGGMGQPEKKKKRFNSLARPLKPSGIWNFPRLSPTASRGSRLHLPRPVLLAGPTWIFPPPHLHQPVPATPAPACPGNMPPLLHEERRLMDERGA